MVTRNTVRSWILQDCRCARPRICRHGSTTFKLASLNLKVSIDRSMTFNVTVVFFFPLREKHHKGSSTVDCWDQSYHARGKGGGGRESLEARGNLNRVGRQPQNFFKKTLCFFRFPLNFQSFRISCWVHISNCFPVCFLFFDIRAINQLLPRNSAKFPLPQQFCLLHACKVNSKK